MQQDHKIGRSLIWEVATYTGSCAGIMQIGGLREGLKHAESCRSLQSISCLAVSSTGALPAGDASSFMSLKTMSHQGKLFSDALHHTHGILQPELVGLMFQVFVTVSASKSFCASLLCSR